MVGWEVVAGEDSFPVPEDVDAEGDWVVLGRCEEVVVAVAVTGLELFHGFV